MRLTGLRRLALAGGVVSNVKATRRVRLLPEVEDVYVFPHMGDGGLALGAAVAAASRRGEPIDLDSTRLDLGPGYDDAAIAAALRAAGFEPSAVAGPRRPRRRSARGRADRDVVPGAAWSTGRARSGIAACWRGPTAPTCAIG